MKKIQNPSYQINNASYMKDANVILAQTSHLVNSQSPARLLRQAGGLYAYFFQKM